MPDLTPDIERELEALDDALAGRRVAPELTELGDLALLLREDRARPSDDFGRSLDARAARGFDPLEPAPRVRRSAWSRVKPLFSVPVMGTAATVLLVVVIAVAAPGGGDDDSGGGGASSGSVAETASGGGSAAGETDAAAPELARESAGADDAATTSSADEPAMSVPPAPAPGNPGTDGRGNRKVERSASLTLAARPRDIDGVSARIQEVTRQQGGFVVSSTVSSSAGGGGGTFELRIPTRNLDPAMAALSRLGRVRERAQRSQDITAEAVSARSRLKDARTERGSLLRQLAASTTTLETQAIRARLRDVSAEIEQARASKRRVNNRAAFSTVAVTLIGDRNAEPPATEDDSGWTPGDAANDALRVLEVAAGVALIALAIALPLALIALFAGLLLRYTRRRGREHALDAV